MIPIVLPNWRDFLKLSVAKRIRIWRSVKYWEIIADNLKKAGWSLGWVSALNDYGRTVWIVNAHRDGKRFVVRADETLKALAELEAEISHVQASVEPVAAYQARPYKNLTKLRYNSANCLKQVIFCANSPEHEG